MLTESELQQIRDEAEKAARKRYPSYDDEGNFIINKSIGQRQGAYATGYITALTSEREKTKELMVKVNQMDNLCENWFLGNDPKRIYELMRKTINEALEITKAG